MNADPAGDRLPPHSREAERCVLGSCLRDNQVIPDVVVIVQPEEFYADAHQQIYRVILDLYEAGRPVDIVTLAEHLLDAGKVEDIGGYAYLGELWDCSPTAAHAEHYARIVHDRYLRREMIHASTEIARNAYEPSGPAEDLVEEAQERMFRLSDAGIQGEVVPLAAVVNEAYDRLDALASGGVSDGIMTGYVDLDSMTAGLHNSELILVAARPSVGKTQYSLNILRNAIAEGVRVFYVSLEQSRIELMNRLLCAQAQINSIHVRHSHIPHDQMSRWLEAGEVFRAANVFIDDTPAQTVMRIASNARRLKMRHGIQMVMIDYIQLIDPMDKRASRNDQIGHASRRLKFLARELQIPIVALCQVNRDSQGGRPLLHHLRDSGCLEQDADTVMIMHRPEDQEGVIELYVEKQRNGPTGMVTLTFLKQYGRFENYAAPGPFGEAG